MRPTLFRDDHITICWLDGNASAFVSATIVQDMPRAALVPYHQRGPHLRIVADIEPGVGQETLHPEREDFGVSIDVAMDFGIVRPRVQGAGSSGSGSHRGTALVGSSSGSAACWSRRAGSSITANRSGTLPGRRGSGSNVDPRKPDAATTATQP